MVTRVRLPVVGGLVKVLSGSSSPDLTNLQAAVTSLNAAVQALQAPSTKPGATSAPPTAKVKLTAVNGTSVSFMTSDSAPPLDQTISPTWTGAHTFAPTGAVTAVTINSNASGMALVINASATEAVRMNGMTGQAVTLRYVDGQTGNRQWLEGVGSSAPGWFEIFDASAPAARLQIDLTGNVYIRNYLSVGTTRSAQALGVMARFQLTTNDDVGIEFQRSSASSAGVACYNRAAAAYEALHFDANGVTITAPPSAVVALTVAGNGAAPIVSNPSSGFEGLRINGATSSNATIRYVDGNTGNRVWLAGAAITQVGWWEVYDLTGTTVWQQIDTTGNTYARGYLSVGTSRSAQALAIMARFQLNGSDDVGVEVQRFSSTSGGFVCYNRASSVYDQLRIDAAGVLISDTGNNPTFTVNGVAAISGGTHGSLSSVMGVYIVGFNSAQIGQVNGSAGADLKTVDHYVDTSGLWHLRLVNDLNSAATDMFNFSSRTAATSAQINAYENNFSVGTQKKNATMDSSTFTGTLSCGTTTTTGTVTCVRAGNHAGIYVAAQLVAIASGANTAMTLGTLPAEYRPSNLQLVPCAIMINATSAPGLAEIATSGVITFYAFLSTAAGTFPVFAKSIFPVNASGNGVPAGFSITFPLF